MDPDASDFNGPLENLADEHPLDRAADAFVPTGGGWGSAQPTPAARPDDWEFLGLEEIEWVEAAVPSPSPAAPPEAFPAEPIFTAEPPSTFGTRQDEPVVHAPAAVGDELDALLGPDPVTGLATLTTLVGRLSASLTHVRNNEGMVGLILVDVATTSGTEQLSPNALLTVAGRLTNHLRDRDMVARIGPTLFAILVDLRPGAVDLETIRQRSVSSLTAGIESSTGGLLARSSIASAGAGSTVTAEELLRQAADQLRGR
jgi:GGDEF domain-containing protein